jgi:hypothetical protein
MSWQYFLVSVIRSVSRLEDLGGDCRVAYLPEVTKTCFLHPEVILRRCGMWRKKGIEPLFRSIPGRSPKSRSCSRRFQPGHARRFRSARLEHLETRYVLSAVGWASFVSDVGLSHGDYDVNYHADAPTLVLTEIQQGGVSGRLTLPGLNLTEQSENGIRFTQLDVPGWSLAGEIGQAALPVFRTTLEIPADVEVISRYDVLSTSVLDREILVYPMQAPAPDLAAEGGGPVALEFAYDAAYYNGRFKSESSVLTVSAPIQAGDHHSVALEFHPFQFNPLTGSVTVNSELVFDFVYQENPASGEIQADSPADLANVAADADYIIITADAYYDEILPLAEWKYKKGFKTYVATMSEVGSTYEDVYDYIYDAYHADSDRPEYVLLVGDHEDVPAYEIVGHPYEGDDHVWASDYEFAKVAGSDNLADLAVGRLPGDTAAQITTMVDKTLTYERTPDRGDWYDDVLIAGMFQDNDDYNLVADRWFMEDQHRAADFLGGDYDFWSGADPYDKGYTVHTNLVWESSPSSTLQYRSGPYPGRITPPNPIPDAWKFKSDAGISATINNGTSIVFHRDHGWYGGWGDPSYHTYDVTALTNGDKLPVTFSLNCETGRFDDTDAFGEAWLRNADGGAVAYTGGMRVSYSGPNDTLHVGIFDSMWSDYDTFWQSTNYDASWRIGDLMNYAKDRVFSGYGYYSSFAILTSRLFNLFGDPELMLRTEVPGTLAVDHPATIAADVATDITVQVNWSGAAGAAVEGALVAITIDNGSDFWVGYTDATGSLTIPDVATSEAGTYDIVVTAQNAEPYEGVIETNLNGVDLLGHEFSVREGNLVFAQGTETAEFSLRNIGTEAAGPFETSFYLSDDADIDPASDTVLQLSASDPNYNAGAPTVYYLNGLASGTTFSDSVSLDVPASDPFATDGEYFIGMVVDVGDSVVEENESNNRNRGDGRDRAGVLYDAGEVRITTDSELPAALKNDAYTVTLSAIGGTTPYTWSIIGTDEYQETDIASGYVGGGTAQGWQGDDYSWPLELPWTFSFYDVDYSTAWVSSNGYLDFENSLSDYSNTTAELVNNVRIAPLWNDLVTHETGEDIYVTQTEDHVTIRWDGSTYFDNIPVDFECVLYADGNIQFNYGAAHSNIYPTIGVSAGNNKDFTILSLDSNATIPADVSKLLTPRAAFPAGLTFDENTGEISGTPLESGEFDLTFQVRDSADPQRAAEREFFLEIISDVDDLQITSANALPTAYAGQSYSKTLEAEGGLPPYTWSLEGDGQYLESDPGAGYVGGGTPQGWHGDDEAWLLPLPWAFPFYGTDYTSVYVCTNGFLDFDVYDFDYDNSTVALTQNVRIAPLWDDLYLDPDFGEDIFVTETNDYVAIRWTAVTLVGFYPVDVEVVLYVDGKIQFNYGTEHYGLTPTIGVSAGNGTDYTLASLGGATSIPANVSLLFSQATSMPEGLTLDEATGEINGAPTENGQFTFTVKVTDSGDPMQTDSREFTLEVFDAFDFGDAPSGYATLLTDDGARHIATGPSLGINRDVEPDGQPSAGADGDDRTGDSEDEDGVVFTSSLVGGETATVEITASEAALLNAWIDFNSDGDWTDAGEQIFTDETLTAGENYLSYPVPLTPEDSAYARFRINTTGGLSFTGPATDGEVEDYVLDAYVAPQAIDDIFSVDQDSVTVILDVLANDFGFALDIESVSPGSRGADVSIVDDQLQYLPAAGFAGNEALTYTISDGVTLSTGTVIVAVGDPAVPYIDFDENTILSYGGPTNDVEGTVTVEAEGASLHLVGNLMKAIDFTYNVTPDTVLEFDFRSRVEGEVHAIGTTLDTSSSGIFKVYGTQSGEFTMLEDYAPYAPEYHHYRLALGEYDAGDMTKLWFWNGHDVADPTGESHFANVRIYESDSGQEPQTDDIIGRVDSSGDWWLARSDGTSFTNEKWGSWSSGITWEHVLYGDFNGDGQEDIVGRDAATGRWYVSTSTNEGTCHKELGHLVHECHLAKCHGRRFQWRWAG